MELKLGIAEASLALGTIVIGVMVAPIMQCDMGHYPVEKPFHQG
jgi:hypothetical protein